MSSAAAPRGAGNRIAAAEAKYSRCRIEACAVLASLAAYVLCLLDGAVLPNLDEKRVGSRRAAEGWKEGVTAEGRPLLAPDCTRSAPTAAAATASLRTERNAMPSFILIAVVDASRLPTEWLTDNARRCQLFVFDRWRCWQQTRACAPASAAAAAAAAAMSSDACHSLVATLSRPLCISFITVCSVLCECSEVQCTVDRVETYLFHGRDRRCVLPGLTCETLSVVTPEWSKILGTYNTPDTAARDRRTKYVMEWILVQKWRPVYDQIFCKWCKLKAIKLQPPWDLSVYVHVPYQLATHQPFTRSLVGKSRSLFSPSKKSEKLQSSIRKFQVVA